MALTINYRFKLRRGTAAEWTALNEVLLAGEAGLETDTRKVKYGDGVTAWNSLAYGAAGVVAWGDITGVPANLTAFAGLTLVADRLPYANGTGTLALATFTAAGRNLVDDADAAAQRTTLGLGTIATQNANNVAITGGTIGSGATLGSSSGGLQAITTDITYLGSNAYYATQGGATQRIRWGHIDDSSIAIPTGLVPAQVLAGVTALYLVTRDNAAARIIFKTGSGIVSKWTIEAAGDLLPFADNTYNLGSGALRVKELFAGTGTINTSDKREKRDIGAIPDEWLDAWGDVQWRRYKFMDGERWHVGLVAQDVRDTFAKHGLDAREIGLLCYDEWEATRAVRARHDREGNIVRYAEPGRKAGNRWGLRYDECEAMEAAWQRREIARQDKRIAAIEAMLAKPRP